MKTFAVIIKGDRKAAERAASSRGLEYRHDRSRDGWSIGHIETDQGSEIVMWFLADDNHVPYEPGSMLYYHKEDM